MVRSLTLAQTLKLQLDEAIQMLRLVAQQERTCLEVAEWLDQNHPENVESDTNPIFDLLMKSGSKSDLV